MAKTPPELPGAPTRLAAYVVDWGRLKLEHADTSTKLTPKAAAVLAVLLKQPGQTVTRTSLFDAVWPGSFSSDEVLTQVILELRRAFDDRQRTPQWIVTVPKLGYRWEGPAPEAVVAAVVPAPGPAEPSRQPSPRHWWHARALVLSGAIVAVLLGLWFLRGAPPDAALTTALPAARPLLREPAIELDPDLDAAGSRLVYVSVDGTHQEIRLRELGAGSERTLVATDDAQLASPRLARQGGRVAYLKRDTQRCEVRVLALSDRTERVVATDCPISLPSSIDWDADGQALYYTRPAPGIAPGQLSPAIHRLPLDGSAPVRVSDSGRWLSTDVHPRVSPDGRWLAWVRDGEGHNRVVLRAVAGGDEQEFLFAVWPYRVAWLGDQLLLAAHGTSGLELWLADRDGKLERQLAREGAGPGLTSSAQGRLVFERHRADDNLWRLDLLRADAQPVQLTQETGSELAPRVSPDGQKLAFLSDASGDLEVHTLDLTTGQRRRWSALAPRVPVDLRWSPDSKAMVLIIGTEHGKRIGVLEADGSLRPLPPALATLLPAQVEWSAGGDLWIAAEQNGRRQLYRARGPDHVRIEIIADRSISSFALMSEQPILVLEDSEVYAGLDGRAFPSLRALARPSDQWVWTAAHVAQAIQLGTGGAAQVSVHARANGALVREFSAPLPEPPLGRHIDLTATSLWYSRRDRVDSDLYELQIDL
jgi:DNA-binding winged helix-turn-helix (wHTH) protein/Tol biopolymer transport system component